MQTLRAVYLKNPNGYPEKLKKPENKKNPDILTTAKLRKLSETNKYM